MSKDFNLPPVDVMEKKYIETKIYYLYPLILERFKEFGKGHANDIDRFARCTIGDPKIYIWRNCYRVNRFHLMAIFKKALKDSGISQML